MIEIRVTKLADLENETTTLAMVEVTDGAHVTHVFGAGRSYSLIERHPFPVDRFFWRRLAGIATAIAESQDAARGER
jgi:hypothetical protein